MIGERTDGTSYIDAHACRWCGLIHKGTCHRVEEIEYFPDGTVKRVRFRGDDDQPLTVPSEPTTTIGPLKPSNTYTVTGVPDGVEVSYTA